MVSVGRVWGGREGEMLNLQVGVGSLQPSLPRRPRGQLSQHHVHKKWVDQVASPRPLLPHTQLLCTDHVTVT